MKFKVKKVDRSEGLKEALYIPGIAVGLKHTMRHFFRNIVGKKDVSRRRATGFATLARPTQTYPSR
jgi:hypothetical protein